MNDKVTVIGAGRMGSALATALFHKGFVTTVWKPDRIENGGNLETGIERCSYYPGRYSESERRDCQYQRLQDDPAAIGAA